MDHRYADRVMHLEPEGALHMLVRARALQAEGRDIIEFQIGQPDVPTYANISDAGITAIRTGRTRYSPPPGLPELRRAIADDAGARRGIDVKLGQVVVMPGGKPTLFFPTLALVQPGDEVIYPGPWLPHLCGDGRRRRRHAGAGPAARGAGLRLRPGCVRRRRERPHPDDRHQLAQQPDRRRACRRRSWNTSPMPRIRHDAWVLSDEIYSRLAFDGVAAPSIAALAGHARAHDHLRRLLQDLRDDRLASGLCHRAGRAGRPAGLLLTHSVTAALPSPSWPALEAVTGPQDRVEAVVAEYQRRRDVHRRRAQRHPRRPAAACPWARSTPSPTSAPSADLGLDRRLLAGEGWGGAAAGHVLRTGRRGLSAAVFRQFARGHQARPGAHYRRPWGTRLGREPRHGGRPTASERSCDHEECCYNAECIRVSSSVG